MVNTLPDDSLRRVFNLIPGVGQSFYALSDGGGYPLIQAAYVATCYNKSENQ